MNSSDGLDSRADKTLQLWLATSLQEGQHNLKPGVVHDMQRIRTKKKKKEL